MKLQSKPRVIPPFIIKGTPQNTNPYIFKNGGCASNKQFLFINSEAYPEKAERNPNNDNMENCV